MPENEDRLEVDDYGYPIPYWRKWHTDLQYSAKSAYPLEVVTSSILLNSAYGKTARRPKHYRGLHRRKMDIMIMFFGIWAAVFGLANIGVMFMGGVQRAYGVFGVFVSLTASAALLTAAYLLIKEGTR